MRPYLFWAYRWRCDHCYSDYAIRLAENGNSLFEATRLSQAKEQQSLVRLKDKAQRRSA